MDREEFRPGNLRWETSGPVDKAAWTEPEMGGTGEGT